MSGGLVPPAIENAGVPFSRAGIACGRRFLFLLAMGVAWLIPAFVDARFLWAMAAWDALAFAAWAIDLRRIPQPAALSVRREWLSAPALSVEATITLTLTNRGRVGVRARIIDTVPPPLRAEPPHVTLAAAPGQQAAAGYQIRPSSRGETHVGAVFIRYGSVFDLAERWARVDLAQTVVTLPNIEAAKQQSIALIRSRQIDRNQRLSRTRHAGRVFESLREYRDGDEWRDVCWTASARRGKLTTRVYELERNQTLWVLIDAGRLMRTRVAGLTKLDYAVDAALAVSQVALSAGDRVGLLSYTRRVTQRLPAARGTAHLRQIIGQLALVKEDEWEADHRHAAGRLLMDQKRRSLIVWMTELAETAATPDIVRAARQLSARHVVLIAVIGQPDLGVVANRYPTTTPEMYESAAAQEVAHRRECLLATLRESGARAFETSSAALTPALVNAYLEIKEQGRI